MTGGVARWLPDDTDSYDLGVFGSGLLVFAGFVMAVLGFLRDATTTIVVGSSVMMSGSAAMMLFANASEQAGEDGEGDGSDG